MAIYINGIACISPSTWCSQNPDTITLPELHDGYYKCIEPDYKRFIEPMVSRRMSRIVKMGIYTAKACMEEADIPMPDAIITGTALGCIEDTEKFLINMINNDEKFLNPTPFIQSTHNTVSSQISLQLKCHAYNVTYSHAALSFESALLDSIMMLSENEALNILCGGIDEITGHSFYLQKRLQMWKDDLKETKLLNNPTKGSIAGESAAFFILSNKKSNNAYAQIADLKMHYKPLSYDELRCLSTDFLKKNNLKAEDIDVLMLGYSGDIKTDNLYTQLTKDLFNKTSCAYFKHLCGEHQTAMAFGMAVAAKLLKDTQVPSTILCNTDIPIKMNNILIYNHFLNTSHAFVLLKNV